MVRFSRLAVVLLGVGVLALAAARPRETLAYAAPDTDVDWKTVLPEAELTKLVAESVKNLQDCTRSPTSWNTKGLKDSFAENEAYILMIYAEAGAKSGNDDLAQRSAALHKIASKIAEACKAKKLEEAKNQVALLADFKTLKGENEAKLPPLGQAVPVKNLMFTVGKQEELLKTYRRLSAAQFNVKTKQDELAAGSLRMAALTVAITAHVPAKDEDAKKTRKLWLESTAETRDATLEMAAAAKAKKLPEFKTALGRMSDACVKCHDGFRAKDD